MRLVSLEVEHFRKFRRPHRIGAFGPRLNVLCGPNEFGKSTLLAALSAVLFQRHGSRTASVRALQTHGSETAPRVALAFAIGDATWHIEKRFLARPFARLTGADGRRFDDAAAETRLADLLGFEPGGKPEHLGLWNALWVAQGGSFAQASVEAGLARTTIASCLEAELGGIAGFGRGDALLRLVEGDISALRDRNGKPVGVRRQLAAELDKVRARRTDLESRRVRLADDVASLRELEREQTRLRAETERGGEHLEIQELREVLLAAERREAELAAARSALSAAQSEQRHALAEVDARVRLRAEVTQLEQDSEGRTKRSREAATSADDATVAQHAARADLESADASMLEADQAVEAARREASAGEDRLRLAERSERLARARTLEAAIASSEGTLGAMPVDASRLELLQKAQRDVAGHRDKLATQATSVEIRPDLGAPSFRVSVAGRPAEPVSGALRIVEDTDIVIDGVGMIRIRPAIAGREATLRRLADAERVLATHLAEAGLASLAAAQNAHQAREREVQRLAGLRQQLAALVPGDEAAGLAAGTAALAAQVETLARRAGAAREVAPDRTALARRLQEAEQHRRDAADRLALTRARHESANAHSSKCLVQAASDRGAADMALRQAIERAAFLADAELAQPYALLEAVSGQAGADGRAAADRLAVLEGQGGTADAKALRHRISRLEEAIANRDALSRKLGERIASSRARIDTEGGSGLDETSAAAERDAEALSARLAALDRETDALLLLAETLRATVGEARMATMLPLTRRIAPKLASLLRGATVECDDDFRVRTVSRGGAGAEPFEILSDGTREQIAVLARLAFAEMLIDRDRPAMVILDDALAFSDETRIEQMFDILTEAATRTQIVLLTCRQDLFARLGGNRLSLEPLDA